MFNLGIIAISCVYYQDSSMILYCAIVIKFPKSYSSFKRKGEI